MEQIVYAPRHRLILADLRLGEAPSSQPPARSNAPVVANPRLVVDRAAQCLRRPSSGKHARGASHNMNLSRCHPRCTRDTTLTCAASISTASARAPKRDGQTNDMARYSPLRRRTGTGARVQLVDRRWCAPGLFVFWSLGLAKPRPQPFAHRAGHPPAQPATASLSSGARWSCCGEPGHCPATHRLPLTFYHRAIRVLEFFYSEVPSRGFHERTSGATRSPR